MSNRSIKIRDASGYFTMDLSLRFAHTELLSRLFAKEGQRGSVDIGKIIEKADDGTSHGILNSHGPARPSAAIGAHP